MGWLWGYHTSRARRFRASPLRPRSAEAEHPGTGALALEFHLFQVLVLLLPSPPHSVLFQVKTPPRSFSENTDSCSNPCGEPGLGIALSHFSVSVSLSMKRKVCMDEVCMYVNSPIECRGLSHKTIAWLVPGTVLGLQQIFVLAISHPSG